VLQNVTALGQTVVTGKLQFDLTQPRTCTEPRGLQKRCPEDIIFHCVSCHDLLLNSHYMTYIYVIIRLRGGLGGGGHDYIPFYVAQNTLKRLEYQASKLLKPSQL
jgi:hypothetical protein